MKVEVRGAHIVGGQVRPSSSLEGASQHSFDPIADLAFGPAYIDAPEAWVDEAVSAAAEIAPAFAATSRGQRAALLEAIAAEIEALGDALVELAARESALPKARIEGERGRTCAQLRAFARVVREGSYLGLRIDTAQPERKPMARADLRRMNLPLGPVAVFGASNFPLAFSVAGGDTASALASGCPVVVKGHPAHPGTSELVGTAILSALASVELPASIFSLLHGAASEVGTRLVQHPELRALAFTGSLTGGRALFNLAAARPRPIPVFAEMGSINPVLVTQGVLRDASSRQHFAKGLVDSMTMGAGQFCTNPGLVVAVGENDEDHGALVEAIAGVLEQKPATGMTMLHPNIASRYASTLASRLAKRQRQGESARVLLGPPVVGAHQAQAACLCVEASELVAGSDLLQEHFGPSTLLVRARSSTEARALIEGLEGQLTATVHASESELQTLGAEAQGASEGLGGLVAALSARVGRILFGGMPTGVEVCDAMVHGGPYPASTAASSTSVGTAAIERFVRPLCWQNAPQSLLPAELRDANPDGLLRMVNGQWSQEAIGTAQT